jgi:HSF-type DNA-binding
MLSLSFPSPRQTTPMTGNNSNCAEDQASNPEAPCGADWKRTTVEEDDRAVKRARITPDLRHPTTVDETVPHVEEKRTQDWLAPFYHYRDFSQEVDPDPLTPLTPPGRVPNFPAKMHAILSRPDLTDIVAWMPHGRSWRVLKPREFELRVIPTYFEHSKFSSFVRQANGWGFRRITQGRDRNSYYHELFLRGLPYLCKQMKRPGVAEKASADAEHEPDFQKISVAYPLPVKADDESILLHCTVQGGPRARMPIYFGAYLSADKIKAIHGKNVSVSMRDASMSL